MIRLHEIRRLGTHQSLSQEAGQVVTHVFKEGSTAQWSWYSLGHGAAPQASKSSLVSLDQPVCFIPESRVSHFSG